MRICVFGNSHTGAIKRAWDEICENYPNHELIFFAARGQGLHTLELQDQQMISNDPTVLKSLQFTSNTDGVIRPSEYDGFLVYAAKANAFIMRHFYSEAVIEAAASIRGKGALSYELISKIRACSERPIWVGHTPLRPSPDNSTASDDELANYYKGVSAQNRYFYHPNNALLIPQPKETIASNYLTKANYSKGSLCLAVGDEKDNSPHGAVDNTHMNDEFGKLWLAEFFESLNLAQ